MDCNCGRFFNSNLPAKSLKLLGPIWIDFNDSQFNTWNDFDLSFPNQSIFFVNELFPILIVFNRFNPSIWNVCTKPKQLLPTSTASNDFRWDRENILLLPNARSPNVMDRRFGRSIHYNVQYQINTSNHKWTIMEIVWFISNCAYLNGL